MSRRAGEPLALGSWAAYVPGKPVGKARARVFVDSRSGKIRAANPERTAQATRDIQWVAKTMGPRDPLTGPVRVTVDAWMAKPMGKPDADNIAKLVGDALNGLWYVDDSQVTTLLVSKHALRNGDDEPGIRIYMEELSHES